MFPNSVKMEGTANNGAQSFGLQSGMVSGLRGTHLLEGFGVDVGPKGDIGAQVGHQVGLNCSLLVKN